MDPTFNNKVVVEIITEEGKKELSTKVFPSFYTGKHNFIDYFNSYILSGLPEEYQHEEDHDLSIHVLVVYFDPLKENHEVDSLRLETKAQRLFKDLTTVYEFLEVYEKRMTASYSEQISAELSDASKEKDLNYIQQQGEAIKELLARPVNADDEYMDEVPEEPEPTVYSEAHMLGETEERIAKANADELEDAKEQADPNSQLVHPTSSRTEEVMLSQTWKGYDDEMTKDEDRPAPAKDKLDAAIGKVIVVCAALASVFVTAILGVEAFHQVMSLF